MIDDDDHQRLTVPKILERSGLSQNKLAKKLGIRSNTLSDWRKGIIPEQRPSFYWRMMRECRCTLEELIEALEGPEVLEALLKEAAADEEQE